MSTLTETPRLPPQNLEAEQSVLGAILLDNASLAKSVEVVSVEDFYRPSHQTIFLAMLALSERGKMIDNITLSEHLNTRGELEAIGGAAYLAELVQVTPSAANVRAYCKIVKEAAQHRQLINALIQTLQAADNGSGFPELASRAGGIQKILDSVPTRATPKAGVDLTGALLDFQTIQALSLPARVRHLAWLPEGGIVMVYGPRGVGKTMLQLTLAAALTTGTDFLKWAVKEPVGVLYVDGEMLLAELRARLTALLPCPPKAALHLLTSEWVYHKTKSDLVLTNEAMRDSMIKILDAHPEIRVVILDNISSLFAGLNEDKKQDWEQINAWLIRLRYRGLTIVLVHHSGKGGQQRGTSGREDALDTVIQLTTPANYDPQEGCHFELRFSKSRSVKGAEVAPQDMRLEDVDGRLAWTWQLLEKSKEEQVKDLLDEGQGNIADIAEVLGITRSYAWKLKKRIEKSKESRP